ncbi:MAG: ATP-binding cassette domain-containing protein, partial [Patescibacteria group bacterium]
MDHGNVIIRFSDVSFGYDEDHPTLEEASFSVRKNAKVTIMGQNGAGKSTILKLITGELSPRDGGVHIQKGATIATALQIIPRERMKNTIRNYFSQTFTKTIYNFDRHITNILKIVNLSTPLNKKLNEFSNNQQTHLLLAYTLIQKPNILLLNEPTNNLNKNNIKHLTKFLIIYPKTILIISHNTNFLNTFTKNILHLNIFTHTIKQYINNYLIIIKKITTQHKHKQIQNAHLLKNIQNKKNKMNFFTNKNNKIHQLTNKLHNQIKITENKIINIQPNNKTIHNFIIPTQKFAEPIATITSLHIIKNHTPHQTKINIILHHDQHIFITKSNNINKNTLLHTLTTKNNEHTTITKNIHINYYHQNFSNLNFKKTTYNTLKKTINSPLNKKLLSKAIDSLKGRIQPRNLDSSKKCWLTTNRPDTANSTKKREEG